MYADFAQVYDRLMQDVDYTGWAAYYRSLLQKAGIMPGALVTECACGTGNLSLHFCEHYQVTGLDLSQEMLSIAAAKLRLQGKHIPLVRQDMQKMKLQKPQDSILATCDGVNYLKDEQALQRFFQEAYRHLKPGGVLCFDVSSFYKLSNTLGNNTLTSTQGDVHYIWYNDWDEPKHLLQMALHVYVRGSQGQWQYLSETQTQRAWLPDELKDQLTEAGFSEICMYGDRTYAAPDEKSPRHHIIAIKTVQ